MTHYEASFAHEDLADCAGSVVRQLEQRDNDPIKILVGESEANEPLTFHRQKRFLPGGGWLWMAVDDQGREIHSSILHEDPPEEMDKTPEEEEFLNLV